VWIILHADLGQRAQSDDERRPVASLLAQNYAVCQVKSTLQQVVQFILLVLCERGKGLGGNEVHGGFIIARFYSAPLSWAPKRFVDSTREATVVQSGRSMETSNGMVSRGAP